MYRPFNDKKKDRTWVRRGMNQKEGPFMQENIPPPCISLIIFHRLGTACWDGLYMWENMYRLFKDKKLDCTCGRRGTNQKEVPYMWEKLYK